jgi:hypothetical protein
MQASRPIIATPVGEVKVFLEGKAQFVPCESKAFADAIAPRMAAERSPDVKYEVGSWDERAATLLEALDQLSN